MITIKEFFPNPIGPDKAGEYITLFNDGDATVLLTGWQVKDKSGKSFSLSSYAIAPKSELVLFSSATKLSLNNSDEVISLFDSTGLLVDELVLAGTAIEGKPVVRFTELTSEVRSQLFDELVGSVTPMSSGTIGPTIMFWLATSLFLAVAAVVVMGTITKHELQSNTNNQSGWNG